MNLHEKLLEVKKATAKLARDATSGSGNFAYQYVTESNVLDKINPVLNELGVICKKEIVYDQIKLHEVSYKVRNEEKTGYLYEIPMLFTFINTEKPEEREENRWVGFGENGIDKGFGSALTYGNRYFFLKYFDFATDGDDVDAKPHQEATRVAPRDNAEKPVMNKLQFDKTLVKFRQGEISVDDITKHFKITKEQQEELERLI